MGDVSFKPESKKEIKAQVYHGPDPEMVGTAKSLSISEAMHKHNLTLGTKESKEKYKNKAKEVLYNFNKKLDPDVINTGKSLKVAEKQLGHQMNI